ncbi:hypothetical protein SAMN05428954_6639 [Streptomyces sp. 2112.3]|nr:hypothetical protein SAMN05428954_6639 [Streptomyces sp. 2112.3]
MNLTPRRAPDPPLGTVSTCHHDAMPRSSADRSRPPLRQAVARLLPARPVLGFLLLLALLGTLSYAAGAAVGPVAPDLQPAGGTRTGGTPADDGDMGGMHGMGGMRGTAPRPAPGGVAR